MFGKRWGAETGWQLTDRAEKPLCLQKITWTGRWKSSQFSGQGSAGFHELAEGLSENEKTPNSSASSFKLHLRQTCMAFDGGYGTTYFCLICRESHRKKAFSQRHIEVRGPETSMGNILCVSTTQNLHKAIIRLCAWGLKAIYNKQSPFRKLEHSEISLSLSLYIRFYIFYCWGNWLFVL